MQDFIYQKYSVIVRTKVSCTYFYLQHCALSLKKSPFHPHEWNGIDDTVAKYVIPQSFFVVKIYSIECTLLFDLKE